MNDEQLLRYSRQIMLGAVDYAGQQALANSSVLIVGAGGLGSPVAMYLAAAGVGALHLADFDRVDLSNLQRQIVHGTPDIGRLKVESARDRLGQLNPDVQVLTHTEALDGARLRTAVAAVDLVVDATDNFTTRFALNAACFAQGVPLVSGAAIRFEGQLSVFDPRRADSPCYRCLYRDEGGEAEACSRTGVLAPVVGVIGSLQATEALKLLLGIGRPLVGQLLIWDALDGDFRRMRLRRDPACPVCGHRPHPE
ncbi:MAG: molybdopterin-synthase adenylyltransferase MoeB [Halothiobacillaceae bacterium]|nr:molybdopterin-synthase adenylyltransferase MoeB [Halothiobacillaceae bacterium]